jgi:hypothetical protein
MRASGDLAEKLLRFDQPLTLREISLLAKSLAPLLDADAGQAEHSRCLLEASEHARQRLQELESLARQSDELAVMDFAFLFDPERNLFSIGFNVAENHCDASFYDLLASEARLCS